MTFKNMLLLFLIALLWAVPQSTAQKATPQNVPPGAVPAPDPKAASPDVSVDLVIDRAVTRENELRALLGNYTPIVETYIQNLMMDAALGAVPKNDRYFLG